MEEVSSFFITSESTYKSNNSCMAIADKNYSNEFEQRNYY